MSVVGLWSGKNYLKHAFVGTETMNKPNTSDGGIGFFSTKVVVHNLGYVPLVKAFYDPDSSGALFPTIGQFSGATAGANWSSPLRFVAPFMLFTDEITATQVTFRTYGEISLGGTFSFYYRIYVDPTL
jgi:hypothetical protein